MFLGTPYISYCITNNRQLKVYNISSCSIFVSQGPQHGSAEPSASVPRRLQWNCQPGLRSQLKAPLGKEPHPSSSGCTRSQLPAGCGPEATLKSLLHELSNMASWGLVKKPIDPKQEKAKEVHDHQASIIRNVKGTFLGEKKSMAITIFQPIIALIQID